MLFITLQNQFLDLVDVLNRIAITFFVETIIRKLKRIVIPFVLFLSLLQQQMLIIFRLQTQIIKITIITFIFSPIPSNPSLRCPTTSSNSGLAPSFRLEPSTPSRHLRFTSSLPDFCNDSDRSLQCDSTTAPRKNWKRKSQIGCISPIADCFSFRFVVLFSVDIN